MLCASHVSLIDPGKCTLAVYVHLQGHPWNHNIIYWQCVKSYSFHVIFCGPLSRLSFVISISKYSSLMALSITMLMYIMCGGVGDCIFVGARGQLCGVVSALHFYMGSTDWAQVRFWQQVLLSTESSCWPSVLLIQFMSVACTYLIR